MEEKKTIKVDFCSFNPKFIKERNKYAAMLGKHYNLEFSKDPDFLFYSCFSDEYKAYKNCVKIYITGENILPNFNECDYAYAFDYIDFGDRYFHRMYSVPSTDIVNRSAVNESFFNRRFCNFIYSNASSGEGAILRQEFCKKLMEYKHVDCPGKILHNLDAEGELAPRDGDWWKSKLQFLKKYKFTIAFENSRSNGYTTEKLMQPLQSFSIPIYWGNPLVTRDFNPKAFINCNDYDNDFDAVIARVKELDNDPDKYLAMLRENPMQPDFDFELDKKFEQWLVNIIEKGNKPFNKDPRDWQGIAIRTTGREIKTLREEKQQLLDENADMKKQLQSLRQIKVKPLVKPFTKVKGNWLYKKVETERYIKTYICGIRTRKRPANLCKYVDSGLQELEKRLKSFIITVREQK